MHNYIKKLEASENEEDDYYDSSEAYTDPEADMDDSECDSESGPEDDYVPVPRVSTDPAEWILNNSTEYSVAVHGIVQNEDADFTNSKREYGDDEVLVLTKNLFERELQNGEKHKRPYLVYSQSKGKVFCATCRLYGGQSLLAKDGFNDWKNATDHLLQHEKSEEHISCFVAFNKQRSSLQGIPRTPPTPDSEDQPYQRKLLERVVSTVKSVLNMQAPFRKENEFDPSDSGLYVELLKLLAKFDPFLVELFSQPELNSEKIQLFLSYSVCEQVIQWLADTVVKEIAKEATTAKYFSVYVGSVHDIDCDDNLAVIIRYVRGKDGLPIERFLQFIQTYGESIEQLLDKVITILKLYNLNIGDCRGQYNYIEEPINGLHSKICELNPLAVYIPNAVQLSIADINANSYCVETWTYFALMKRVYVYFTLTPSRWEDLKNHISSTNTVNGVYNTWSSREEACVSLNCYWEKIIQALEAIVDDTSENPHSRCEAEIILNDLDRLEMAVMAVVWGTLLERFNDVNTKLKNSSIYEVVELYRSLVEFVKSIREMFHTYEATALSRSLEKDYDLKFSNKLTNKKDEVESAEQRREYFKVNVFYPICDNLISILEKRQAAYGAIYDKFGFLVNLTQTEPSLIVEQAKRLQECYSNDLEEQTFVDECLYFRELLLKSDEKDFSVLRISQMSRQLGYHNLFPNLDIAIRMLLCTPALTFPIDGSSASNSPTEDSLCALKNLYDYFRSRDLEDKISVPAVLSIERGLVKSLNCDEIIDKLAQEIETEEQSHLQSNSA